MTRLRKPCLTCGTPTNQTHCPAHQLPSVTYREQQRRQNVITDWINQHGNNCPGHGVPPHPSHDLTADHVTPRSQGGEHGPLTVLCRQCNTRRGAPPQ